MIVLVILPKEVNTAKKTVKLYRLRMQIEEGFCDTKNQQFGLQLLPYKESSIIVLTPHSTSIEYSFQRSALYQNSSP
jgi:hypothetical protein